MTNFVHSYNLVQDQQLDTRKYLRENNIRAHRKVLHMTEIKNPVKNNIPGFNVTLLKCQDLYIFLVYSDILMTLNQDPTTQYFLQIRLDHLGSKF